MSANTPGFVGARLTEARNARGISAVDLAEIIKVSPQSISKYENGHQSPKLEILYKICAVLQFSQAYFMRSMMAEDSRPVFWRGRLSAPPNMQERAKTRLEWMKETIDYLSGFFDFPQLNVPDIPVEDIDAVNLDFIESAAQAIRQHWDIRPGPMPDVIEKLETNGIFVSRIHVRADKLDAFSQWSDKFSIPFIILGRDKSSAVRQRFDALHELAHIALHRNITQKKLNTKATYKSIEAQADKLASCLLLPEKEFLDELYAPSLDGFLALKERWGASVGAMIMRSRTLDIINDDEAKRMWINYTRRAWRKHEPLDDKLPKEEPHLIRKSFEMLISERVQTTADIKKALPFPLIDLEEIADLEPGALGGDIDNRAAPSFKDGVDKLSNGNVVQFVKN